MTGQLALVEARRLLRNPYLWTVTVAALALVVRAQRTQLPNLAEATITMALATVLVTATLMVLANRATLRDRREGVPETLGALPGRAEVRTRAVLLAAGCLGAVLVAAVIGVDLLLRLAQPPVVASVDLREALAAVLGAAVMVSFGVAVGRWAPSPIVAPATLGILVVGAFAGPLLLLAWHLPLTVPYQLQAFGRPAGPRLWYLASVLVLLAGLALLRHGRRPLRLAVVALALAGTVTAGIGIAAAAPGWRLGAVPQPGTPKLECADRNGITYCVFPGFAPWIPSWARAAEPVAAALPPAERHRMPTIAQHTSFDEVAAVDDGRVLVRLAWGRGDAAAVDRTQLAGRIAAVVTGLAIPGSRFDGDRAVWCDARGQARTLVALWLAGQIGPLEPATAGRDGENRHAEASSLGGVGYGARELGYARELLGRPDARELIWQRWDELLNPATTIDTALPLLGLLGGYPAEPPTGDSCD